MAGPSDDANDYPDVSSVPEDESSVISVSLPRPIFLPVRLYDTESIG